jgi:hypothetical protein
MALEMTHGAFVQAPAREAHKWPLAVRAWVIFASSGMAWWGLIAGVRLILE